MKGLPKKNGKLNRTHFTKMEAGSYGEACFRMHVIPVRTAQANRKTGFSEQGGPTLQTDSAGVPGWARSHGRMLGQKVAEPTLCVRKKR